MKNLESRTTGEIVMLILTVVAAFILVVGAIGIMMVELLYPEQDTDPVIAMMFDITKVIVGAVIGFAAGKAYVDEKHARVLPARGDDGVDRP